MNYRHETNRVPEPLSYSEICAAVSGDPEGMQRVIDHYHHYLCRLARCDTYGTANNISWIDEELLVTLEDILLEKVLDFKIK